MWLERVSRYLLPGDAERDEGFRQQIAGISRLGLIVIGAVQITVSLFMMVGRLLIAPDPEVLPIRLWQSAIAVSLGLLTIAASRVRSFEYHRRAIAIAAGVTIAGVLMWCSMLLSRYDPSENGYIPGQVTLVILVGVAAIPFRPTDTMLFGMLCESTYVILALAAQQFVGYLFGVDAIHVLTILMLTLLATGLTAILYEQRWSIYRAHQDTLRASEQLRMAEARNLLAQNAASVGRLAAALSHELNSPIGALISGVDTLLLLAARMATSSQTDQGRLVRLQADLRRSIRESSDRLKEIVARMQRFTNLDRAEVQAANINEILSDVALLLEPRAQSNITFELDLKPVPAADLPAAAVERCLLEPDRECHRGGGRLRRPHRRGQPRRRGRERSRTDPRQRPRPLS